MERKLATVLFVDLVDSTALVTASDPEVVRRRVTQYFQRASASIERHGGTVEKFAGDAVMAAFGVPLAHEDDAERAVRAAFEVLQAVDELGLQARAGVESGEVVVDDGDSTFATGEAVVVAARLQQSAPAGVITLGPGARRLTVGAVDVEDAGAVEIRPGEEVWSWRATRVLQARQRRPQAAFVGREPELELLRNAYDRTLRDRRPHLTTVFGDPGVGKSRLIAEFAEDIERATVLTGRALPYGEGITYWPIASMVKASAGITDDDPAAEAFEKLRVSCESDAVADLLGVALGLLGAAEGIGEDAEIAWATLRWAEELADAQPLVLVFEDIQWADERLLEVVENLARARREIPLLIVCVARFELLDARPAWGGGNPRAASIELVPLDAEESDQLAAELLPAAAGTEELALLLEKAEGNPLFLEETARMLVEANLDCAALDRIPDSVQALIAARIDLLAPDQKRLLQRAAVIGRVFWRGALEELSAEDDVAEALEALIERDLIAAVDRSTISGDRAFQFTHVLVRDVAYGALTKAERAETHRRFAGWVPAELVEVSAFHLDRACALLAELDGSPPHDLAAHAAATLEEAGRRAYASDAFAKARRLLRRALELEPTPWRLYLAADAARQLGDLGTVAAEMQQVREQAVDAGDARLEGRALTGLASSLLGRDGDPLESISLARAALATLPEDDYEARADALRRLASAAWWTNDLRSAEAYTREALAIADRAERPDLRIDALGTLQWLLELRLELDAAEEVLRKRPAADGVLARAREANAVGALRRIQGRLPEAAAAFVEARSLYLDVGASGDAAWCGLMLGWIGLVDGLAEQSEKEFREAARVFQANEELSRLGEAHRALAEALLVTGRIEEADRFATLARSELSPQDLTSQSSTMTTLGLVRAAQGCDEEAEALLRDAVGLLDGTDYRLLEAEARVGLARFLRARNRLEEAAEVELRLPDPVPGWLGTADAHVADTAWVQAL
ncbi:MAG TPA: AAA family ATPase [Gaiellaceae bacterium]|nr:AAA family ATPase [Gaiellaceae bacterium]